MKRKLSMLLVCILLVSMIPATSALAAAKTITTLTEPIYDAIGNYSEGLVCVKEGDNYKYLDKEGKVVIDLSDKKYVGNDEYIAEVGDFHDGLALITVQKEATEDDFDYDPYVGGYYIDTKGNIVLTTKQVNKKIPSKGKNISGLYSIFSEGVTISDTRPEDGNVCIIKKDGSSKWYFGAIYDYYWYTEGLLSTVDFAAGDFQWGYVNKDFKKVISFKYEDARPFNQSLAPVKIKGKWGFINKAGKTVIKAQFEDLVIQDSKYSYQVFNDGLASVQKDGKWGAIDKKGKTVIAFKYEAPLIFSNGYAYVEGSDGKYIYIDQKGKTVIKSKFEDANYFTSSGVAVVGNKGIYKLIDTKGKQIGTQTWKFDGTGVSVLTPEIIKYKKGEKWGISKVK